MVIPCAFGPLRLGVRKVTLWEERKRFNAKAPGREVAKMRHLDLDAVALAFDDASAFHPVYPVNPVSISAFPVFLL
jgi:hypothetical protein